MSDGLEDVVAADTVLSKVDGAAGRLTIRGYALEAIAGRWTFERVVALLFEGFFDDLAGTDGLRAALGNARCETYDRLASQLPTFALLDVYDGMRAGVAQLPDGATLQDALRLIAAPAVLAPALVRLRSGNAPIAPDAACGHADDVLRMMAGTSTVQRADALDTYFVTVCDHGLNASTFAARIVASTRAGLTSATLAGMSALKGPLHGGAPGPVIAMLDAIEAHGDARAWLEQALARGDRLMGFGHRVYRVRDPRADALKGAVRRLGDAGGRGERLALAERIEAAALDLLRAAKPGRSLQTNVEFYTALLLEALGIPADAFTCMFAMSRVTGWLAHAREQQMTGRLIRPKSHYIGPAAVLEGRATMAGSPAGAGAA